MPVTTPPTVDPLTGTPPNRGQSPTEFNTNQQNFVNYQVGFVPDINATVTWLEYAANFTETKANAAETSETNAANSAAAADESAGAAAASAASAASSPSTSATSTTSLTPGLGSKSFTLVETGKDFRIGQFVLVADTTTPTTKFLRGGITAFNSGTGAMTITVSDFAGSTSGTTWAVSLSSPPNTYGMPLMPVTVTGTSVACATFGDYTLTNTGAATTATLPASPAAGDWVNIDNKTGRSDGVLDRNGQLLEGLAENSFIDIQGAFQLKFIDASLGWQLRTLAQQN
jgi:hypothetical protein